MVGCLSNPPPSVLSVPSAGSPEASRRGHGASLLSGSERAAPDSARSRSPIAAPPPRPRQEPGSNRERYSRSSSSVDDPRGTTLPTHAEPQFLQSHAANPV